ncbi:MAG: zinc ribbon domain-containing protein [Betaproteobacteria bacterium]|nr:zinc ribbon domain-containing protein [Betaproteobacteria bacterium]
MPIYEYQCACCNNEFETLVRSLEPSPGCPACNSTDLRKKLSSFAALTGSSFSPQPLPAACQSCGNPEGPGACGFN